MNEMSMENVCVFPGMELIYESIHLSAAVDLGRDGGHVFEIRHCREGRLECQSGGEYFFLGPGDLSIGRPGTQVRTVRYPLSHYHGILIRIHVDRAPHCLSCVLEDVNVQPRLLMQKFCSGSAAYVVRSQPGISHIFSELYSVPASIKKGYCKVKVLELLLFLSALDLRSDESARRQYSLSQRELAHSVSAYLLAHRNARVTLEQLSEEFHVSGTMIKTSVRTVYGVCFSRFVRLQKMESAAELLRDTDLTVLDIASRHGYDNASKFAAAFKEVTGMTPREYRATPTAWENRFA